MRKRYNTAAEVFAAVRDNRMLVAYMATATVTQARCDKRQTQVVNTAPMGQREALKGLLEPLSKRCTLTVSNTLTTIFDASLATMKEAAVLCAGLQNPGSDGKRRPVMQEDGLQAMA